jgi:murein DD-endopeptidase MepM/ murein hydrolase activator NlpD
LGLYQRIEPSFGQAGLTAALSLDQVIGAAPARAGFRGRADKWLDRASTIEWVPDLGVDIGSLAWFRGLATCTALCGAAILFFPGFKPIPGPVAAAVSGDAWEESRAQSISPIAWGADSGRRMAANKFVTVLADAPERPMLELTATLGQGDSFRRVLERAGVGDRDAAAVNALVGSATNVDDIAPGTLLKIVLGRHVSKNAPRPIESLAFRARFDLGLSLSRSSAGQLSLTRIPIAIDRTPLRIRGLVGESLYRSARAAGVPAEAVAAYIRAIATKLSLGDVAPEAGFDIVVGRERAQTGEVRYGNLLYAGLSQGDRVTRLLQWTIDGRTEWFEASGVGQKRGGMAAPVEGGRVTSGFGMRFHPILGYTRFHRGMDFGAAYGSPVHAVTDGLVNFAGYHGGNGNFIRLNHSSVLGTSYSHLSRILVSPGQRVSTGQVIGYVGSTGLSTGPHLHFEVYQNGVPVNPRSVSFASSSLLNGEQLAAFKATLQKMLTIPVIGAR